MVAISTAFFRWWRFHLPVNLFNPSTRHKDGRPCDALSDQPSFPLGGSLRLDYPKILALSTFPLTDDQVFPLLTYNVGIAPTTVWIQNQML